MGPIEKRVVSSILTAIRSRHNEASSPSKMPSNGTPIPARVREARFSDFSPVAELKQRWGLAADSFENWDRLWKRNPAVRAGKIQRPIGWVLEAGDKIVGYIGNISLLTHYGDRMLETVASHALVVEPPYRSLGVSLVARFYRQPGVDLYLTTSAIESVGKMAMAFKCSALPQPDYDTVLFWVLRPHCFGRSLMKKLSVRPSLATLGAMAAAVAVGGDTMLRGRCPKPGANAPAVTELGPESIGEDFQELWAAKLKERPRLLADRTPATLRWYFQIPGDKGQVRVFCCYEKGRLAGYAVVRTDTHEHDGLQKSLIADMVVQQDDPATVRALWVAAYQHAKKIGSHVLEVQGFPSSIRELSSDWHPYRRQYPACPYYYRATDPAMHDVLREGAAWYACAFDGDATLIRPSFSTSSAQVVLDGQGHDLEPAKVRECEQSASKAAGQLL